MSKQKILVHLSYSINSISGHILCKQLRYIKTKYSNSHDIVLVLSNLKTQKRKEIIERLSGIHFSDVIVTHNFWKKIFIKDIYKYNSWKTFYHEENWFNNIKNIDAIYMFGGLINGTLLRDKDSLNTHVIERGTFLKFVSASTYISTIFQLLKLSNTRGIALHEIICDPQEASLDTIRYDAMSPRHHHLWFCYSIPRIKAVRLDYIQTLPAPLHVKKTIDFCFGSTFVSKYRWEVYDKILPLLNFFKDQHNSKILIYHKQLGINTCVTHDEYVRLIEKSRYTLIIPAYDVNTFSMLRFYEAVSRGCLPLIFIDTVVEDFRTSFGISKSIIKEITIHSHINSFSMCECRRLEIIKYLQQKLNCNYMHDQNIGLECFFKN